MGHHVTATQADGYTVTHSSFMPVVATFIFACARVIGWPCDWIAKPVLLEIAGGEVAADACSRPLPPSRR
jgi:hypothetical protein